MIDALRKEVRRLSGVRLDSAFLVALLENVIIKRELIDGEQGDDALAYVKKLKRAFERQRTVPDAEASPSANQI
jgi:hypothetical protein